MKAPRIQAILQDLYERTGRRIWRTFAAGRPRRSATICAPFPASGPKTAACVLMFNLGRPVLPVDTHVHRVSQRLGLIGPKVSADGAHDPLPALLDDCQVYSFHVHLIEHGRRICHAQRPECGLCPVRAECDWFQAQVWGATA